MRNLLILVPLLLVALEGSSASNRCGEVLTETSDKVTFYNKEYRHHNYEDCKWTIVARQNEMVKIYFKTKTPLFNDMTVTLSRKGPGSTEEIVALRKDQNGNLNTEFLIRGGGGIQVTTRYYPYNCYQHSLGCTFEFGYVIEPISTELCEETIKINSTDVITLPRKKMSLSENGQMGCAFSLKFPVNQTARVNLMIDLEANRYVEIKVMDGPNASGKPLHISKTSKVNEFFTPTSGFLFVGFLYPRETSIVRVNDVALEITVVNSALDCEFKDTFCQWAFQNGVPSWEQTTTLQNQKALVFRALGVPGTIFELTSPEIETQEDELCINTEFKMVGKSVYALYVLFVENNRTRKSLLTAYGDSSDQFRTTAFNVPPKTQGFLRFILTEGRSVFNASIFYLDYVRSSWGKCGEEKGAFWKQRNISWFQDYSGTEIFQLDRDHVSVNLPYVDSSARLKSNMVNQTKAHQCLKVESNAVTSLRLFGDSPQTNIINKQNSRNWQYFPLLNSSNPYQITLEVSNNNEEDSSGTFNVFSTILEDKSCKIDCNFLNGMCSWSSVQINDHPVILRHSNHPVILRHSNIYKVGYSYLEFLHPYDKSTTNEITSHLIWDREDDWFCLTYKIGSIPALCLTVGVYSFNSTGSESERILTKLCGPTSDYNSHCVRLPEHRPIKVFVRTEGKGRLADDNVVFADSNNVNVSSFWTSKVCEGYNCGWSQDLSSIGDERVVWNVDDGTIFAQRSCCVDENSEKKGIIWSPSEETNLTASSFCVSFEYILSSRVMPYAIDESVCRVTEDERSLRGYMTLNYENYQMYKEYHYHNEHRICEWEKESRNQTLSSFELLLDFPNRPVWNQVIYPNNGNHSQKIHFTLNSDKGFYRVGFAALLSQSDLTIRDFKLTPGECDTNFDCHFEDGLCDWSTRSDNPYSFTWTHSKNYLRPISQAQTGPFVDCSLGPGGFAVANSSWEGESAELISNVLTQDGPSCFTFCYHMFGVGIGRLELYSSPDKSKPLWNRKGNQGNLWYRVRIPLPSLSSSDSRIKFVSYRNNEKKRSNFGDIAIDSVSISKGVCSLSEEAVTIPEF